MTPINRPGTQSAGRAAQGFSRSLFLFGLSFRTAPVALRERLDVRVSQLERQIRRLRDEGGLDEVVLLSTCNRVEVYGTAAALPADASSLLQLLAPEACDLSPHVYVREGAGALAHLFAVASGLESMVLGETEITGQVKHAYEHALAAGVTGRILNQAFQKALQTAKEIRTHTGIGRGATSVGSVAGEVAEKIFGQSLSEQTVMVLGAGQMSEACIRHLAKKGVRSLLVANRSFERAQSLAVEFGGRAVQWGERLASLAQADIAIVATSCPHWLLTRADFEALMPVRRNRPLFLIDISVPRNIDPAVQRLDNAYLYNVDDLEGVVRQNICQRQQARAAAEDIISLRIAALIPRLAPGRKSTSEQAQPQIDSGWALPFRGAEPSLMAAGA